MPTKLQKFLKDEQGQGLKEHALLLLFLVLGAIATEYLAERVVPDRKTSSYTAQTSP